MYEIALWDTENTDRPKLYLPTVGLPEEIETTTKMDNEKYDVLTIGEVQRPGMPALRTYSMKFELPADHDPKPSYYLNWFRESSTKKAVLRLIINRKDMQGEDIYNTNIKAIIDQYKISERAGCVGDMFVEMKLVEYRDITVKVIT